MKLNIFEKAALVTLLATGLVAGAIAQTQNPATRNWVTGNFVNKAGDTMTGSLVVSSNPTANVSWIGSVPALATKYTVGTSSNATTPQLGSYIQLDANAGFLNRTTAYKIGSGILVRDTAGAAGATANLYGHNAVVSGYAGTGGSLLTAYEGNVNNNGVGSTTLAANNAAYAFVAAPGGTAMATAGFYSSGVNQGWAFGFGADNVIGVAGFYDNSNSPNVLQAGGTHTTGINFASATITNVLVGPSSSSVIDGSGNATFAKTTSSIVSVGAGAPTLTSGAIGLTKIAASASAPGAGTGKLEWVAGTNAGTCKLIAYGGTSVTAVTVIDNVGAGC